MPDGPILAGLVLPMVAVIVWCGIPCSFIPLSQLHQEVDPVISGCVESLSKAEVELK